MTRYPPNQHWAEVLAGDDDVADSPQDDSRAAISRHPSTRKLKQLPPIFILLTISFFLRRSGVRLAALTPQGHTFRAVSTTNSSFLHWSSTLNKFPWASEANPH